MFAQLLLGFMLTVPVDGGLPSDAGSGHVVTRAARDTMPAWLRHDMEQLVAGTGRWITDNSAYKSEGEPWDQYGIEWKWGFAKRSITGRLFGLKDGKNIGTFWDFHMVWHPGRNEAILFQWGSDGTMGEGPMKPDGKGGTAMEQTFHAPDGGRTRVGHQSRFEGNRHITESFDIKEGAWVPRRTYVWVLQPGEGTM